jgi:hypothetical protein
MSVDQILKGSKFLLWFRDPATFFRDIYGMTPYPYQADILRHLATNPKRMIIVAGGGTGKTKLLACIALWLTIVYPKFIGRSYSVIIISGSEAQAKYLYEYSKFALQDNKYLNEEVDGEPLISITRFKDRSLIMAVPNSLKAVQGKHMDCCIVDEGALAGDFIIQDTLRIVSASDKDLIILSGTPMVYSSYFVEINENPERYPDWERFHWSVADCPGISKEKWEEAKKLPEDMFVMFWEGKAYAGTETLIPIPEIRNCSKDIPKFDVDPRYPVIAGLDWGWRHFTALVLIQKIPETDTRRVLYTDAWRREDFADMHDKIWQICKDFNVTKIYSDAEDIGENQRLSDRGIYVDPIAFNQNKVQMQSHMKILFHQEKIKLPESCQQLIQQLRKYKWTTKEDDDLVDALQLALKGVEEDASTYYYEIL